MANTNVSHGEVKSICDALECSPSQHDDTGHYGGTPHIHADEKDHKAADVSGHFGDHTSDFQAGRPAHGKVPGYKGKMAKKANQV